jgi:dihydroorotase
MASELLQQVRVVEPSSGTDRVTDVLIAQGEVAALDAAAERVPPETVVRDCRGLVLAPGLCDLYSHSGEPGNEQRETLASLAAAAVAGGFTRLGILPDTAPPLDRPAGVAHLQQCLAAHPPAPAPTVHLGGALTPPRAGGRWAELGELARSGVTGFSDARPIGDLGLVRRLLQYVQPLGKPVALSAADATLRGNGVLREGIAAARAGLAGDPGCSEAAALAALLETVAAVGTPVHLMRISTARGVELIAEAKARGLPVTASATWMHLLLEADAAGTYDPNLRLDPPLGTPEDRAALVEGVRSGTLDAIAIDRAAYTAEEKTVVFAEAPPGAIGLELALPLLWQAFVASGQWSALDLWRALSAAPRRCLHQAPASLAAGEPAELVLFDPHAHWSVTQETLHTMGTNTPWYGQPIAGRVVRVWQPPADSCNQG